MTINQAIADICERQIPKEINGVRTKYTIRDYDSVIGVRNVELSILPIDVRKEGIGVTLRYNQDSLTERDYITDTSPYNFIKEEIERMLCLYVRNIIGYFNGKIIEVHTIEVHTMDGDTECQ